jgi:hypothetical protein
MKPLLHILCECEALALLRHVIRAPFSWNQRILRVYVWGPSGTLAKKQGTPELVSDYWAKWTCF